MSLYVTVNNHKHFLTFYGFVSDYLTNNNEHRYTDTLFLL